MVCLLKLKYVARLSFPVAILGFLLLLLSCLGMRAPSSAQRGIEFGSIVLDEVFPVFYKYYDDHPLGTATLVNRGTTALRDVTLSFFSKGFMDDPKVCATLAELGPGERKDVKIYALFADRLMEVSVATKVTAEIVVQYRTDGQLALQAMPVTLGLRDRNAMELTDSRRLAIFVAARDPSILVFAKGVTASLRDKGPPSVDAQLLSAIGMLSALDLFGIAFLPGTGSPHSGRASNPPALLSVQFPRQTLEYRGGSDADLSILYAALLESVGVETAFLTVPGHIFLGFSLGMSSAEARNVFTSPQDLIYRGTAAWVPLDLTDVRAGFRAAWAKGAREWREAVAGGAAAIYPLHEAWQEYEPVQLPGEMEITLPDRDAILRSFQEQAQQLVERDINPAALESPSSR